MPKELTWSDPEDIGILLSEAHPEIDPLSVRFTDLHKYVTALQTSKTIQRSRTNRSWKQSRWPGTPRVLTAPKDSAIPRCSSIFIFQKISCGENQRVDKKPKTRERRKLQSMRMRHSRTRPVYDGSQEMSRLG